MKLLWRENVSEEFAEKVIAMAERLGMNPNDIMAAMAHETGETFSPSIKNPNSKCVGLIQFCGPGAKTVKKTQRELAQMSAEEQLDYVEKYFKAVQVWKKKPLDNFEDVYIAVHGPGHVGSPKSYTPGDRGALAAATARYRAKAEAEGVEISAGEHEASKIRRLLWKLRRGGKTDPEAFKAITGQDQSQLLAFRVTPQPGWIGWSPGVLYVKDGIIVKVSKTAKPGLGGTVGMSFLTFLEENDPQFELLGQGAKADATAGLLEDGEEAQDPTTPPERLRALVRAGFGREVAGNPNAPLDLLEELVAQYPEEVFLNEAGPLGLVEDPGRWVSLRHRAQWLILSRKLEAGLARLLPPDRVRFGVAAVARHAPEFERRFPLDNGEADDFVREVLAAVTAFLQGGQRGPLVQMGLSAVHALPLYEEETGARKVPMAAFYVLKAAQILPDTSSFIDQAMQMLQSWAQEGKSGPEAEVAEIRETAAEVDLLERFLRETRAVVSGEAEDLEEAQNPETPQDRLEALARSSFSAVAKAVARNPQAGFGALEFLVEKHPQPVLENPGLPMLALDDPERYRLLFLRAEYLVRRDVLKAGVQLLTPREAWSYAIEIARRALPAFGSHPEARRGPEGLELARRLRDGQATLAERDALFALGRDTFRILGTPGGQAWRAVQDAMVGEDPLGASYHAARAIGYLRSQDGAAVDPQVEADELRAHVELLQRLRSPEEVSIAAAFAGPPRRLPRKGTLAALALPLLGFAGLLLWRKKTRR